MNSLKKILSGIKLVVFDFDGVFTDNLVIVNEKGEESVVCNRSDGFGLARLKEAGVEALILSTEKNPVVEQRAKKLKLTCFSGIDDKETSLRSIVSERSLSMEEVAFVGNDINDSGCLALAGLAVIVADAHPEIGPLAKYVTKKPGGKGAVREICDMIYFSKKGKLK